MASRLSPPAKRMLTKDEAASYCGFTSVARFETHAQVRAVNYGNSVRYDRLRLDEWLDTLTAVTSFDEDDFVAAAGTHENQRARN